MLNRVVNTLRECLSVAGRSRYVARLISRFCNADTTLMQTFWMHASCSEKLSHPSKPTRSLSHSERLTTAKNYETHKLKNFTANFTLDIASCQAHPRQSSRESSSLRGKQAERLVKSSILARTINEDYDHCEASYSPWHGSIAEFALLSIHNEINRSDARPRFPIVQLITRRLEKTPPVIGSKLCNLRWALRR